MSVYVWLFSDRAARFTIAILTSAFSQVCCFADDDFVGLINIAILWSYNVVPH
jgi:hypothetical protein